MAEKGREEEVFRVFRKWGLDAVTIGVVTDDGKLRVRHHGQVVAEIPNRALADEAPQLRSPAQRRAVTARLRWKRRRSPRSHDLNADLLPPGRVAAISARSAGSGSSTITWSAPTRSPGPAPMRRSCASRRPASRSPCRSTATAAIAISIRAKARSWPWRSAAGICRPSGALPVAATNNLNFGNPERPEIMAQLVEAIEGMAEACAFFETPITGGNVSLYNETLGEGIYPTPVLGIVGLMKTAMPVTDAVLSSEGASVLLLGGFGDATTRSFGGSAICKGDSRASCGDCRRSSTWTTKSACRSHARNRRRGTGRIGARSERWRTGRRACRMLHRSVSAPRSTAHAGSERSNACFSAKRRRGFCLTSNARTTCAKSPLKHGVECATSSALQ